MVGCSNPAQGQFGHIRAFQKAGGIRPHIQHRQTLARNSPAQHRQQSRNIGGHHRHGIKWAGAALSEPCLNRIGMRNQPVIG